MPFYCVARRSKGYTDKKGARAVIDDMHHLNGFLLYRSCDYFILQPVRNLDVTVISFVVGTAAKKMHYLTYIDPLLHKVN